jgi:MATE family multidrug resistance protein
MMSFTLKGFIDMAMVGRLGTDALGAVGFASIATWFALCFPWGILRGQRPLVAQYIGARQPELAFSFGAHAFYLAFLSGLLLIVFGDHLVAVFGHFASDTALTSEAIAIGEDYYRVRLWWLMPTLLTFAIAEYLRSTGRTRMPMAVDLLAHPLNLLFNYALIFGHFGLPAMGARGAALGTGLADLCALLVIVWLARPRTRLPLDALKLHLGRLKEVVSVGWTGGIQFSLENLSFLSITWIVGHTNQAALAVHQAGIQLIHLSLLPAVAIGDAGSVLIGRYVGELEWDAVKRTLRSTLEIMIPFMGMMSLVFLVFGRPLSGIFLHGSSATRCRWPSASPCARPATTTGSCGPASSAPGCCRSRWRGGSCSAGPSTRPRSSPASTAAWTRCGWCGRARSSSAARSSCGVGAAAPGCATAWCRTAPRCRISPDGCGRRPPRARGSGRLRRTC